MALICYGCSDYTDLRNGQDTESGKEIHISCRIEQEYVTRADDNGFADGDAIGVYIVDYDGNAPSDLKSRDNNADNIKFVYSEADADWNGSAKIYWTDDYTPVDAYGYYPFTEYLEDVRNYNFTISKNQGDVDNVSGLTGYEASDFLWAKASGVQPGKKIELLHNHMMASVIVTLVEGDGFDGEWNDLEKDVTIDNTIANTLIDLSTGKITVLENAGIAKIHPYNSGNDYRAIVAPQTVDAGKTLVTISIGADSYQFTRDSEMKYSPSKLHRFVIKVDKKPEGDYAFTLVNEDITPWENDAVGHSASTKAYTVIHCPEPGSFKSVIEEAGIKTQSIEYLKLTGTMNQEDFNFFNSNFRGLLALNLKELRTVGIPLTSWTHGYKPGWGIYSDGREITFDEVFDDALPCNMLSERFTGGNDASHAPRLSHVDLPDNCKYIGVEALAHIPLTGTLTIPEGVKWIGDGCIGCYSSNSHHISTLVLPSTVEYIGEAAFAGCEFTNELLLPDNLKYIGDSAFVGCINTFGQARIPQGLVYLGNSAFGGVPLTGTVVFPAGIKRIPNSFGGTKISGIYIPEGVEEIAERAFSDSELRGDIHLPNSIKKIGWAAFTNCKINHINIPTSLEVIPGHMLDGCIYLTDSIVIPENVRRINDGAFLGCKNVQYIHIPSGMEIIGGDDQWGSPAFGGCYSLEELRCDALEPPTLIGDPFSGDQQLHKDNFTLVVPEKSVSLYQNAQGWREFKRISPYRNLVFRPQIAKVLNKGGSRDVILNADAGKQWKVTECPDWLHIS
ncbi:MAG: leucine-rich repeat protein, partial [Muribaculaceae bacterium]|nr:leucine-rich repeat protein [Muribaculaceae bacterium]